MNKVASKVDLFSKIKPREARCPQSAARKRIQSLRFV